MHESDFCHLFIVFLYFRKCFVFSLTVWQKLSADKIKKMFKNRRAIITMPVNISVLLFINLLKSGSTFQVPNQLAHIVGSF